MIDVDVRGNLLKDGIIQKGSKSSFGYPYYRPRVDGKRKAMAVHRMVALKYIPNPNDYPIINHINGIPDDNRVENLEWCTQSYNIKDSFNSGRRNRPNHDGEKNPRAKLTTVAVCEIRRSFLSVKKLAKRFRVSCACIYDARSSRTFKF